MNNLPTGKKSAKIQKRNFLLLRRLKIDFMKIRFLLLFLGVSFVAYTQVPQQYYAPAANKKGAALRASLHTIIKNHTTLSYSNLWTAFSSTDKRSDNGKVWDIYSDNPSGNTAYFYTFGSDQCGNYSSEGDCYNREHSVPKNWFDDAAPMYTDLFHLYPTDGYVNGRRGNLPFGEVNNATWTSSNGSQLGSSAVQGYSGTVFEPIDAYKGDLARSYFYFTVCYKDKNLGQDNLSMFTGGSLKPWALKMLIRWHNEDPVSQKEIDRNNAVYHIQGNRNPFIDFPELVEKIYGNDSINPFNPSGIEDVAMTNRWQVFPNPAQSLINIIPPVEMPEQTLLQIFSLTGQLLYEEKIPLLQPCQISVADLNSGVYLLQIQSNHFRIMKKIIKN